MNDGMEKHRAQPGEETPAADAVTKTLTVLIADDDPDVRTLLCAALPRRIRAVEARDGNEAVRLARELIPDLLVCDSQMPGLQAADVIVTLRARADTTSIPVILISGAPDLESIAAAARPVAFLQKPFVIEEFQRLAMQILASHSSGG